MAVAASEIQKNFGVWHDKALERPVAISRYGRTTAYLISSSFFEEVMGNYRKCAMVKDLGAAEIELISNVTITEGEPFNLADIPELEEGPPQGFSR